MKKKLSTLGIIIILSLCFAMLAEAALKVTAEVDKSRVVLQEQIRLTISVSGNVRSVSKPQLPGLDAFDIYSAGQSQSVPIINGQLRSSTIVTYILMPLKAGEFVLDKIELGRRTQSITPIKIVVAKSSTPSRTSAQGTSPRSGAKRASRQPAAKLFVEADIDNDTAYVNQQIVYSFRFYRSINLVENPEYNPSEFTGFWVEDLPPQRNYNDVVAGRRYVVTEIRTALFPTAPGEYTINQARLQVVEGDIYSNDPFSFLTAASGPLSLKRC